VATDGARPVLQEGVPDTSRAARAWAWLGRHRFALAMVVAFVYVVPYFPRIHSANELPRVYLTQAMVHDGTFAIDRGVARWGTTADVSPHAGHHYSNKAPGSSMLAVPAYLVLTGVTHAVAGREPTLGEMTWAFRLWTGIVPTLLFLWLLAGFLPRFALSPTARRLVLVGYGLGSMAFVYSVLFIAHQLSAVAIGTAWILTVRVLDDGKRDRWMLAAGFAAGCAPLVDYQALFAALPIAAWATVRLIQTRRGWKPIAWAIVGAAVPIAILLAVPPRVLRLAVEDRLRRLGDLRVPPPEGVPGARRAALGGLHRLDGGRRQRPGRVHAGVPAGAAGLGDPVAARVSAATRR
jgi:hypothetical protein